jgi:hypothetical protein
MARVFVGSSVKGLPVAEAIQKELEHNADVTLWSQGIFRQTNVALEDLIKAVNDFDFAVFVFIPEDATILRKKRVYAARDNVLFELGLFLGKLGRERNFFVAPKEAGGIKLHLPSDLSGLNPAPYDASAKNLQAAVGPALYDVKQAIRAFSTSSKDEALLYDGRKNFKSTHFVHRKGYFWKSESERIPPEGEGSLKFLAKGVIRVERTNEGGRYEIELRREGHDKPSFTKKHEPRQRTLQVSCEAKVDAGTQRLRFILKEHNANQWAASKEIDVESQKWKPLNLELNVLSTVDLLLRIDVEKPSQVPSCVYLRRLVVAEVSA